MKLKSNTNFNLTLYKKIKVMWFFNYEILDYHSIYYYLMLLILIILYRLFKLNQKYYNKNKKDDLCKRAPWV